MRALLDRLIPDPLRTDTDLHRRARLLVVCLLLLVVAALFFIGQNLSLPGDRSKQIRALAAGGVAILFNFFLLRRTLDPLLVARIMCIELVIAVSTLGALGTGLQDASLNWLHLAPLLGAVLVGARFGGFLAAAVVCILVWFHRSPAVAPVISPEQLRWVELVSSATVTLAIGGCASIFELLRQRATKEAEDAIEQLRKQREELERLRL